MADAFAPYYHRTFFYRFRDLEEAALRWAALTYFSKIGAASFTGRSFSSKSTPPRFGINRCSARGAEFDNCRATIFLDALGLSEPGMGAIDRRDIRAARGGL